MQYTLKKSLGQHFLKDETVCHRIVDHLNENPFQNLLEVGPGGGALTKFLLKIEDINFKAIELDEEKVAYLHHTYPQLKDKVINTDILLADKPFETEFTLVGNFPYNISTQILFKVLDWKESVPVVIGMFQKEVAERVVAKEGSKVYGIISVLLQVYYDMEYLFDVPPEAFNPPPKVMSGVIRLKRKETPVKIVNDKKFATLVKAAFNQRRKTLRNATKFLFNAEALQDEIFNKRAEQLSVQQFADLSFKMN